MNLPMLKTIIKREKRTYSDCANALGISTVSFQRKVNGKQPLFLEECDILGYYLDMSGGEKINVFLDGGNEEVVSDDDIKKLERIKTLLTEIKELKEDIFGKQGMTFEEIRKSADEYQKEHGSSFFT